MDHELIESRGVDRPQQLPVESQSATFDIGEQLSELHRGPDWECGTARRVVARYPGFQITLRAMKANTRIPEHHNPGRICAQTVRGHIRMNADGRLFDLPEGKALVLDQAVTHDVEALEESAFLLTSALPPESGH
jgi:quercetin dioxygenase-like cupin family protein